MRFSEQMLDKIAPELSRLSPFEVRQIRSDNFDLTKRLLQIALWEAGRSEGAVSLAVLRQMLRRASAGAQSYRLMSDKLESLFESYQADSPNLGFYFDALDAAEACLLNMQITIESMNMPSLAGESLVTGSEVESCRALANSIKHFGERRGRDRSSSSMPIWFVTHGVNGETGHIEL